MRKISLIMAALGFYLVFGMTQAAINYIGLGLFISGNYLFFINLPGLKFDIESGGK